MPVQDYFDRKAVVFLEAENKTGAFRELAAFFSLRYPSAEGEDVLFRKIMEREKAISTWISKGIAIPHVILPEGNPSRIVLGISRAGIPYEAPDGEPVRLIILIAGDRNEHIEVLRQVALRLSSPSVYEGIIAARGHRDAYLAFTGMAASCAPEGEDGRPAISGHCLRHAGQLAREIGARHIFVHVDCMDNLDIFEEDKRAVVQGELVFVTTSKFDELQRRFASARIIQIPFKGITRANQIGLSVIFALSRNFVDKEDLIVSVFGLPYSGVLDAVQVTEISREFKIFFSLDSNEGFSDLEHQVLVRAIELAGELADEGREGKPSGCIFVLGDYEAVKNHCQQMIINPFKGYAEGELNILDPALTETVKEFSKIDGAFIVRGDGVLVSAGTYLRTRVPLAELPPGLGARHAAAAAITMVSRAAALALSESTRKLSLFRGGEKIMEL
ncbi:MAG: PTS sugar transporter subunit IIA [Spirochaetia bacterium]|jgi:DNA integrity scanning protein DisA with diadenylate cyclase activity/mannitol/fructose-specific phosphotransferase system IIA component (Ntr-type)|nr:PTS sugar transporter subunit IIA [Spirochaetia bacterium]